MTVYCLLFIMVIGSVIGGSVYYYSPTNQSDDQKPITSWYKSVIMGVGAVAILPILFISTQSRLLDHIDLRHSCFCYGKSDSIRHITKMYAGSDSTLTDSGSSKSHINKDSLNKNDSSGGMKETAANKKKKNITSSNEKAENNNDNSPYPPAKGYLLWLAYCVLAAATGFRFIKSLMSKIVSEEELRKKDHKISVQEDHIKYFTNTAEVSQDNEIKETQAWLFNQPVQDQEMLNDPPFLLPALPPIKHPDDPQNGRFGGSAEINGKKLEAAVSVSGVPELYWVELNVVALPEMQLKSDVVFYLHNSFSKSIRVAKTQNGKASLEKFLAYGAFTVGAVTDYGTTLLELDLSDPKLGFPKKFQER